MNRNLIFFSLLLSLVPSYAWAVDTQLNTDTVTIGRRASSSDKSLTFDINQGSSNPKIRSNVTNQDIQLRTQSVKVGNGTAANQTVTFDTGAGTGSPFIRYNNSTGKLEFANDGTTTKAIGSGAGGSGINVLSDSNADFEAGTANWTASGGSFTATAVTANLANGAKSGSFDASASSQTLTSAQVAVPAGLFARSCLAKILYKTAEVSNPYTLKVIDGSSNVLASTSLGTATTFQEAYATFLCPSSGTIAVQISSSGDAAAIVLDDVHLGSNTLLSNISQASLFAVVRFPATTSAELTRTNTALGSFGTVSAFPAPTVDYNGSSATIAATDVDKPAFTVSNMPPGVYEVQVSTMIAGSAAAVVLKAAINDGTTTAGSVSFSTSGTSATESEQVTTTATFSYSTSGTRTFELYAAAASNSVLLESQFSDTIFTIRRWPSAPDQAVRFDQVGWKVDANISGSNVTLGTSSVSSYAGIENGSLSLTNNSGNGNLTAQIPCSSTNSPSGTTCSAGNESIGVSFTLPAAGDALACASFQWVGATGAGGSISSAFEIVETPSNAQTISQEGNTRLAMSNDTASTTLSYPVRVCGTFKFSSAGQKTLRLFYEQLVGGTVNTSNVEADGSGSVGQRDIHWEVYPLNQTFPMPVIVNSVTTSSSGQTRTESAQVTPVSSSSCTIQNNPGSWISTATTSVNGECTLAFATAFSGTPLCTAQSNGTAGAFPRYMYSAWAVTASTTGVKVRHSVLDGASALSSGTNPGPVNEVLTVTCSGPK